MIQQVEINEQSKYWEFRELVGNKVSSLLADRDALTNEPLYYVKAAYAWDNWSVIKDETNDNIEYFLMNDPLFTALIHDDLLEKASGKFPTSFGTDEPEKVLEALNKTLNIPYDSSTEDWNRQTSYSVITNQKKEKILFLGLFRGIGNNPYKGGRSEFQSGYLHALSHFYGRNNQPISSNLEPKILPENFIEHIIRCLFENEPAKVEAAKNIDGDKFMIYNYMLGGEKYNFKFYYSRKFDIYFLSTIHRDKKSKK